MSLKKLLDGMPFMPLVAAVATLTLMGSIVAALKIHDTLVANAELVFDNVRISQIPVDELVLKFDAHAPVMKDLIGDTKDNLVDMELVSDLERIDVTDRDSAGKVFRDASLKELVSLELSPDGKRLPADREIVALGQCVIKRDGDDVEPLFPVIVGSNICFKALTAISTNALFAVSRVRSIE